MGNAREERVMRDACLSRRTWLALTAAAAGSSLTGCNRGPLVPAAGLPELIAQSGGAPPAAAAPPAGNPIDLTDPANHACVPIQLDASPEVLAGTVRESFASASQLAAAPMPTYAGGIIPKDAPLGPPAKAAYLRRWDSSQLLQGKILKVAFVNGHSSLCEAVMNIAQEWSKFASLEFKAVKGNESPHILVRFDQRGGHSSYVGDDSLEQIRKGLPSMNLAFRETSAVDAEKDYGKFIVLHEFGHAIGMVHEHQQPGASLQFKENDPAVLGYFRQALGNVSDAVVRENVFKRWKEFELKKFSDYDPKSIMHYAFAAWMFVDATARVQNFELSYLDKMFAAIMYPGPNGPKPVSNDNDTGTQVKPIGVLSVDGEAVSGSLSPGMTATYQFTISSSLAMKDVTVYSEGGTQVSFELYGPNDPSKQIGLGPAPEHGTSDLTNDVIQKALPAGEYVLKVRHTSPRGGGRFSVTAKSGRRFTRLLESNRTQ